MRRSSVLIYNFEKENEATIGSYITLFRVKINKTKKDDNYGRSQTNTARDSRALNPVFDASTRDASTRAASRRDHS